MLSSRYALSLTQEKQRCVDFLQSIRLFILRTRCELYQRSSRSTIRVSKQTTSPTVLPRGVSMIRLLLRFNKRPFDRAFKVNILVIPLSISVRTMKAFKIEINGKVIPWRYALSGEMVVNCRTRRIRSMLLNQLVK